VTTLVQSRPSLVGGPAYMSTNAGVTYAALSNPLQLACLGQRSDGVLFGCAANQGLDNMALTKSSDTGAN
jgi:hypothetical protein